VPVYGKESIDIARIYEGIANYLLLDSHRPSDKQIGALGVPHDWSISRRIVEAVGTSVRDPGTSKPKFALARRATD
jgi:phosphoribosylanthranilate isomerase